MNKTFICYHTKWKEAELENLKMDLKVRQWISWIFLLVLDWIALIGKLNKSNRVEREYNELRKN